MQYSEADMWLMGLTAALLSCLASGPDRFHIREAMLVLDPHCAYPLCGSSQSMALSAAAQSQRLWVLCAFVRQTYPQTHRHNTYLNTHILSPSWCLFLLKSIVGRNSMWENVANFIQQVESTYVMQTFTAVSFSFSILQNFLCFPFFSARICSFITTALDEVILFQTGLKKSRCGHMEDRTYDPCPQGCQSYPKCMHSHMKMLTVTVAVGFIICQVVTFHIFTFHD